MRTEKNMLHLKCIFYLSIQLFICTTWETSLRPYCVKSRWFFSYETTFYTKRRYQRAPPLSHASPFTTNIPINFFRAVVKLFRILARRNPERKTFYSTTNNSNRVRYGRNRCFLFKRYYCPLIHFETGVFRRACLPPPFPPLKYYPNNSRPTDRDPANNRLEVKTKDVERVLRVTQSYLRIVDAF